MRGFKTRRWRFHYYSLRHEVEAQGRGSRYDCHLVPSCKLSLCFLSAFSVAPGHAWSSFLQAAIRVSHVYRDRPCISSIFSSLCFIAATLIFSHLFLDFFWSLWGGKRLVSFLRFFATSYSRSVTRASIFPRTFLHRGRMQAWVSRIDAHILRKRPWSD